MSKQLSRSDLRDQRRRSRSLDPSLRTSQRHLPSLSDLGIVLDSESHGREGKNCRSAGNKGHSADQLCTRERSSKVTSPVVRLTSATSDSLQRNSKQSLPQPNAVASASAPLETQETPFTSTIQLQPSKSFGSGQLIQDDILSKQLPPSDRDVHEVVVQLFNCCLPFLYGTHKHTHT